MIYTLLLLTLANCTSPQQDPTESHPGNPQKLSVSKAFPHQVVFVPKDLCGMALLDLSVDQGVCQIQHFTNHVFAKDSINNLILITLCCPQLESGCGFHLLEEPSMPITYITPHWLTSMQDYMG
jgi:hypothetical protein